MTRQDEIRTLEKRLAELRDKAEKENREAVLQVAKNAVGKVFVRQSGIGYTKITGARRDRNGVKISFCFIKTNSGEGRNGVSANTGSFYMYHADISQYEGKEVKGDKFDEAFDLIKKTSNQVTRLLKGGRNKAI